MDGPILIRLREAAAEARLSLTQVLSAAHLSHLPTRDEVLTEARVMFAKTRSLDEIVDRAYQLLFVSVEMHLTATLQV